MTTLQMVAIYFLCGVIFMPIAWIKAKRRGVVLQKGATALGISLLLIILWLPLVVSWWVVDYKDRR